MDTFRSGRALVTGASQGIGRAIALRLADAGATVVGTYRTSDDSAQELQSSGIEMVHADFSSRGGTSAFIGTVQELEPFDFIVNNAGIVEFELWSDFTIEAWDRTFEVNVNAALLIIMALSKHMAPGSAIVNVASTDGYTGSFGSIAYSASKAALINLTKSIGNVLGERGVRVNAVAPGWVDTDMSTPSSYDATANTPLGRNGAPADIASAVVFLLSADAAFVNGATLIVDGGYTNVDTIMKQECDELKADPASS